MNSKGGCKDLSETLPSKFHLPQMKALAAENYVDIDKSKPYLVI